MSSTDHSASSSSTADNDNMSAEGDQLAELARALDEVIEAYPSIVSISVTVRENYNEPTERGAWRREPFIEILEERPPNRNIGRLQENHETFIEARPYRATNVMAPHMEFLQPNMHAYGIVPPHILPMSFIGNPEPSTSPSFQGRNVFPYASYRVYYYPTHPPVRCFIPVRDTYASQQSYFFNLLDDLRTRLRRQIEFYFSSENLETDFYLKSHMDANGFVPITLIAGFREVVDLMNEVQLIYNHLALSNFMSDLITPLTSDEEFIIDSLRYSDDMEVQGDKVRNRHER